MGGWRRRATLAGSLKIARSAPFVESEEWNGLFCVGAQAVCVC